MNYMNKSIPSVSRNDQALRDPKRLMPSNVKDSRLSSPLDSIFMTAMKNVEVPYTIMLENDYYTPEPWCLKFARSVLGDFMVPPRKKRARCADVSPQRPLTDSQSFQKGMSDCWYKVRKNLRPNALKRAITNDAARYVAGLKTKFD